MSTLLPVVFAVVQFLLQVKRKNAQKKDETTRFNAQIACVSAGKAIESNQCVIDRSNVLL